MNHFTQFFMLCFCICLMSVGTTQAQKNATLLGQKTYEEELNDIWGYVAPDGSEYALVGTSTSISVVDIRDVNNLLEVGRTQGRESIWRDIKTWGEYAYAVDDESGESLIIIDLQHLPDSITYTTWNGDGDFFFSTAHNIFIDENGIAYLFGANYLEGGAVMLDLKDDPLNPTVLGIYNDEYVHDGFVRGDTMWTAEIYAGTLNAVDVSDKANPVWLGGVETPSAFAHNCWVTDDNKVAYTTDEVNDAYLAAYDVSDVTDMKELDRVQSNPGNKTVPHNTFVFKDWLVTSYYKDGLTVHDITYPDNMIQVGDYDTNPLTGGSTDGAWGVYPYLPSETVLVTDIAEGLYVIKVDYVQACYLHGKVKAGITGIDLSDVRVEIGQVPESKKKSKIDGTYRTGIGEPGTYQVTFKKAGFEPKVVSGVEMSTGNITTLDVELRPLQPFPITGNIVDENNNPIANANIVMVNEEYDYSGLSNAMGQYTIPSFYEGVYNLYVGAWGYETVDVFPQIVPLNSAPVDLKLRKGIYQDDFILDLGWVVTHNSNSDRGIWERAVPEGTDLGISPVNPDVDESGDLGDFCYVTGNDGDFDFLRGGESSLISPVFDLSDFELAELSYSVWFINEGDGFDPNDSLVVYLSNGNEEIVLEQITRNELSSHIEGWQKRSFPIGSIMNLTDRMRIRFSAGVRPTPGQFKALEAGVDAFKVVDLLNIVAVEDEVDATVNTYALPNPFSDYTIISLEGNKYTNTNPILRLFNIKGQEVRTEIMSNGQVTVERGDLTQGIYFYAIEDNGNVIGKGKLVVKN